MKVKVSIKIAQSKNGMKIRISMKVKNTRNKK